MSMIHCMEATLAPMIRYNMEGAPGAYDSLYRGEGAPGAYDSSYQAEGAPGAYDSLHAGRSSMMSEMRVQKSPF